MSPATDRSALAGLLRDALADAEATWSLGSFGALATFLRAPDEVTRPLPDAGFGLVTDRGAIALDITSDLRPVAYETGFASGWNHALALCLPEAACARNRRHVVTEIGPDRDAAQVEDRDGILFDLGLGLLAVDACLRSRDPKTIAVMRAGAGRPVAPGVAAMNGDHVFVSRIGRIEVFGAASGAGSPGPRRHILPELLRRNRTHAATTPIPAGWAPCGALHPPHPCKDLMGRPIPFRRNRHEAFQALLARWGDPDLLAAKWAVAANGRVPEGVSGRHARSARRAAEAQERYLRGDVEWETATGSDAASP